MRLRSKSMYWGLVLFLFASSFILAAESKEVSASTGRLEEKQGLLTLQVDSSAGKVWLEVPSESGENGELGTFLYSAGLSAGLGSNPLGLDRGELGETRLVTLRRMGDRLLFV